ncbi:hypothetical protein F2Q70_00016315 [Brassica cretica]|uniref:Uncharacterized protein n=1 Tax=Brassica cretica TaxID=69181 RepID=A0A8S9HZG3_BRACR|nr:hypothetical protein F2Q70_00016315 [Brassica cretica]
MQESIWSPGVHRTLPTWKSRYISGAGSPATSLAQLNSELRSQLGLSLNLW